MNIERAMDIPLARPLPPGRELTAIPLRLSDGYESIAYRCDPPAGVAHKLPVAYFHGIQSHPGWFVGSADQLALAGHTVFLITRRGSGANQLDRGHAPSARQLLDDVDSAINLVLDQAGAARTHLLGVSWGGKLLTAWAAATPPDEAASLILAAPGIAPRVDLPISAKLRIAAAVMLSPRKLFDIPLNDPQLFTNNEHMREYLRADRLALHRATARFLYASRQLDMCIRRTPAGAIAMPTTLLLAERDKIINSDATVRCIDRLTKGRCQVVHLPAAHTIEFEHDHKSYYSALADAMKQ